eukprot:6462107-Amphidinium_carterae.1
MPSLKDAMLQQDTVLVESSLAQFGPVALDAKLSLRGYDYGRVLDQLYSAKIIERGGVGREECGLFFVYKKDMSLRIIFDTRRSNCHFQPPPTPFYRRATSGDVEVCFYQYYLPEEFRDFFTLPSIDSKFLSDSLCKQLGITRKFGPISFRVRVCPMGWNWAVVLVQKRQLQLLQSPTHFSDDDVDDDDECGHWLRDKVPSPPLTQLGDFRQLLYIDNFAVLSLDESLSRERLDGMVKNLALRGIVSHKDDQSEGFIGLQLDPYRYVWTVKTRRFWRLVRGLQHVLNTNRKLTGRQVERLVGHITSVLLLRRELLCLIHCTYTFISESYETRQPLWPSVRGELASVLALLPTVRSETSLPWSPRF